MAQKLAWIERGGSHWKVNPQSEKSPWDVGNWAETHLDVLVKHRSLSVSTCRRWITSLSRVTKLYKCNEKKFPPFNWYTKKGAEIEWAQFSQVNYPGHACMKIPHADDRWHFQNYSSDHLFPLLEKKTIYFTYTFLYASIKSPDVSSKFSKWSLYESINIRRETKSRRETFLFSSTFVFQLWTRNYSVPRSQTSFQPPDTEYSKNLCTGEDLTWKNYFTTYS